MAEVLVTGGDTELGRVIAAGFLDAGHNVIIAGARREDLELNAKQLDISSIVFDNTDPASVENARTLFPHHIDTLVNVPAPLFEAKDPRTFTLADLAGAWHNALDATVVSAALTVQIVGDHLRSGGSIINVVAASPRDGSADAAIKAALSDWTAGQAAYFGTRGITVNAVAPGLTAEPGYDGLGTTPPSTADEFARLAVFLSTPAARHITGQTMHVSRGAMATLG
ncbi:short-chain dehydrogenase [Mycobacterium sp. NS-7484]|uniref:SDR family oxidoreductase n=1 Tax=unclassified Mycobacterium TaxID=2642494 RepID=UPI0007FC10F0|nr:MULTISPECIES: SDR family oxidoreductase [unclassified Mycobacterium]OBG82310.1 short-chain dehydrogenase [Mycobacterium sp. E802]OMB99765.1 short-chain dehydrogenase [Mycobacterium sp. NS-7484]